MSEPPIVPVAVAVLQRPDGRVLLAQRLAGTPYPGYWEFPGGKLEPGELPRDALARELHEELGIEVVRAAPWLTQRYHYPHANVELAFFRVFDWRGEPQGRDGQAIAWQIPGAFQVAPLLPANTTILRALELPPVYGISMADEMGEDAFLVRVRHAVDGGLRLIQLREKSWPVERIARLAERILSVARPARARVLLNGDAALARALGCDGVHWPAATLLDERVRADGMLCAASCHDRAELEHAAALGVDFAVLGPVAATPTHPWSEPLGWARVAALLPGVSIPVYALGGLSAADLETAMDCGAHGVALRRAAWES
ncbi:MAG TPA: Nudix family hydrolase [Casimicrobiaceae bacterium]|nr:Nudix family hydrolase [Casimicrobiaceae bacterium]